MPLSRPSGLVTASGTRPCENSSGRSLPEETLRRIHTDACGRSATDGAPLERRSPTTCVRAGRARDAVPLLTRAAEWAASVGAYRDGAEWAELALEHADRAGPSGPALRCESQLLHGAGRAPARMPPMPRPSRSRPSSACPRCERTGASVPCGGRHPGRQGGAPSRPRPSGRKTSLSSWSCAEWWLGNGRSGGCAPAGRRGGRPRCRSERAGRPERHARPPGRCLGATFPASTHARLGLAGARRPRVRRLSVRDRVRAHSGRPVRPCGRVRQRLRAQAQQAGARRGEAFAATVLGETELFTDNLEAAAHSPGRGGAAQPRGWRGRRRVTRTYAPGRGAASLGRPHRRAGAARGGLELAHISPSPSICCSSSTACCSGCPRRAPRRWG